MNRSSIKAQANRPQGESDAPMKPNISRLYALATPAQINALPALEDIDRQTDEEKKVHMHFFHERSNLNWYVLAWDPVRKEFFGLVNSFELQLRPFTLHDMQGVQRNTEWRAKSLASVRRDLQTRRAKK